MAQQIQQRDDALYERYAKHLEAEHRGKFGAISLDGQVMIGPDRVELVWAATERFGEGSFSVRKIGFPYVLKWRRVAARFRANVLFAGEEYLLGREALDRMRVCFDRGKRLEIEF